MKVSQNFSYSFSSFQKIFNVVGMDQVRFYRFTEGIICVTMRVARWLDEIIFFPVYYIKCT